MGAETGRFLKGMNKDAPQIDQPDNTYRDAINALVDSKIGAITTDIGNELSSVIKWSFIYEQGLIQITVNFQVIGSIPIPGDAFIVFGVGEYNDIKFSGIFYLSDKNIIVDSGSDILGVGNQWVINKVALSSNSSISSGNSKIIPIFISPSKDYRINKADYNSRVNDFPADNLKGYLNFDKYHPISGEFKILSNGNIMIYFTDNKYTKVNFEDYLAGNTSAVGTPTSEYDYIVDYNPPRALNLTRQLKCLASEYGLEFALYPNDINTKGIHVDRLNIFTDSGRIPIIELDGINLGGGLKTGAYYLGLAYSDEDGFETNVLTLAPPVYIVPTPDDSFPIESINGAPAGTQTNKSIRWEIKNSNIEYKYLVPYIIQLIGNDLKAVKLEVVDTYSKIGEPIYVTYTGIEKVATEAVDKVVIDKVRYLTSKVMAQLDNKLYLANMTARKDLGFQRFANSIKVEPIVKAIPEFDNRRFDIYNINEGYSQLIFPDNKTESYSSLYTYDPNLGAGNAFGSGLAYQNDSNFAAANYNDWHGDSTGRDGTAPAEWLMTRLGRVDTNYLKGLIDVEKASGNRGYRDPFLLFGYKSFRRQEVYAFYISFVLKDGSESYAYHIPGQEIPEQYKDWDNEAIAGFNGDEVKISRPNSLIYQYIDTSQENTSTGMGHWENESEFYPDTNDFDIWTVSNVGTAVKGTDSIRGLNVRHHKMPGNKGDYSFILRGDNSYPSIDSDSKGGVRDFKETVRILGVKMSNIKIPKLILSQVQGYKIYFAKRTQVNKTIIGQSLIHPANLYLAANFSSTLKVAKDGPYFNVWAFEGRHITGGVHTKSSWTSVAYLGQPVVKFHDFNLLKNKHSLAGATHIDLQYIVTMQNWRGGYKNSIPSELETAYDTDIYYKGTLFYKMFKDGYGDPEYSWVHADLANTTNPNYDITQLNTSTNIPIYDEFYNIQGVRIPWGQLLIGAAYWVPGQYSNEGGVVSGVDVGTQFRMFTSGNNIYPNYIYTDSSYNPNSPNSIYQENRLLSNLGVPWNDSIMPVQHYLINPYQTIFMLEPNAATYINGVSLLKPNDAASFKGASYLSNLYGETAIALGMTSGPPVLGGYKSHEWTFESMVVSASRAIAQEGINALFNGDTPGFSIEYNGIGGEPSSTQACNGGAITDTPAIITSNGTKNILTPFTFFEQVSDSTLSGFIGNSVYQYNGPVEITFNVQILFKYGPFRRSNEGGCSGCGGNSQCGDRCCGLDGVPHLFRTWVKQAGASGYTVHHDSTKLFYEDTAIGGLGLNGCANWCDGYIDDATPINYSITLNPGARFFVCVYNTSGNAGDAAYLYNGRGTIGVAAANSNPGDVTTNNGYWLETFLLDEKLKTGLKNLILRKLTQEHHILAQEEVTKGRPNLYLANLCAEKSDVFEPFDQQKLVWTGVYRDLSNADLETGKVDAFKYNDVQSGGGKKNPSVPQRAPQTTESVTPLEVCPGDWITYQSNDGKFINEGNFYYLGAGYGGPLLNKRNIVLPGGTKNGSIELQIPQGTSPGVKTISIYKGPEQLRTFKITVIDCTNTPPSNNDSLYIKGDTIDVFGGDTYICKYSYRTTSFDYPLNRLIKGPNASYTEDSSVVDDYIFGDIPLDINAGTSGEYPVMSLSGNDNSGLSNEEKRKAIIQNERNWSWGNYDLFSTLFQVMVESDDNLNYRHSGDVGKGVSESNSIFFDKGLATDIIFKTPLKDLTKQDNLLYEDHYSAVQDIRVTIPFPKRGRTVSLFPNRIVRSNIQTGSFVDAYRTFLALEYKDIALNRGPINNIFVLESLLYIHTEKSLFKTQGKQTVELSDESEAYVGSGDIFIKDIVELLYQSNDGYLGLYDKTGSILTKDGYIFLSYNARKLFLIGGKEDIKDLTVAGMSRWFIDNIPFKYDKYYGMNSILLATAPNTGFGFTLGYDPIYKRVFLTKMDLETSIPITKK